MKINKKLFLICVIIFLLFTGSVAAIFLMKNTDMSYKYANIYIDDKLYRTINLDDVKEPYTIRVDCDDDNYNIIEVRHGSIGMIEASCPDGLCINMGFISNSVMPITCLPNHIVIQLTDDGSNSEADVVAY